MVRELPTVHCIHTDLHVESNAAFPSPSSPSPSLPLPSSSRYGKVTHSFLSSRGFGNVSFHDAASMEGALEAGQWHIISGRRCEVGSQRGFDGRVG